MISSLQIRTSLQSVNVIDEDFKGVVEPKKEHNGFAPNFIHSLDASHLMMTVNDCTVSRQLSIVVTARLDQVTDAHALCSLQSKGVTFGSVHDSFWTHAATVPDLNASLRDAFVRLHETDTKPHILETLRNQVRFFLSFPLHTARALPLS